MQTKIRSTERDSNHDQEYRDSNHENRSTEIQTMIMTHEYREKRIKPRSGAQREGIQTKDQEYREKRIKPRSGVRTESRSIFIIIFCDCVIDHNF